ncbi:hypothetical protein LCGC14_2325660 [marine sediment metagenome]|uniref:Uncharacterized protein n=1 Tax=marine sediment metagenome TaxID=412755 RepID=A0A0F9CH37_9ZZZZ
MQHHTMLVVNNGRNHVECSTCDWTGTEGRHLSDLLDLGQKHEESEVTVIYTGPDYKSRARRRKARQDD